VSLRKNWQANNLAPEDLQIHGSFFDAQTHFSAELGSFVSSGSLVIVDAEGAEFDFMNSFFMEKISNSYGVVEVHDWDGSRRAKLKLELEQHFSVTEVSTGSRDPYEFSRFIDLPDDLAWACMSEGRRERGLWFCWRPKAQS